MSSTSAFDRIVARAHDRVIDRYRVAGAEVPSFDVLVGDVLAEISSEMDRHLRKAVRHLRAARERNVLLRRAHGRRDAAADLAFTDSDWAMLASGVPVPPEVTDGLGVGPEPWHPEHHRIESD